MTIEHRRPRRPVAGICWICSNPLDTRGGKWSFGDGGRMKLVIWLCEKCTKWAKAEARKDGKPINDRRD